MALRITYVPFNSSHLRKTLPVLHALRDAGADLRILCLDAMQVEEHRVHGQIESAEFGYHCLPGGGYRPSFKWYMGAVQRGRLARSFESLLADDRSDVFVFSDDGLVPTRLLAKALVRRRIPYVVIADGIQPPLKSSYRLPARDRISAAARRALYGWGPRGTGGARRVLVITRTCRDVLRGYGIAPERIIVVGSPEYDRLAAGRPEIDENAAARAVRERLGLIPDRPIVFYAHQQISGQDLTGRVIWALTRSCRRIGAALLVKFHPHADEDPARWRSLADGHGLAPHVVSFFKQECTSIEALQVSTACVTAFSTVSLEALILRRPVVVLQFLPIRETLTLARDYGAALDVNGIAEIDAILESAVRDAGVRERLVTNGLEALRRELHGLDGRSLQRTVEAIAGIMD